jgi:hypothetical protein
MRTNAFVVKTCVWAVTFASIVGSVRAQYSPPTKGLVGWWRGDGDATDSSGNGHNGVLQGTGFTNGVFGQAFAAGSGKRVSVPDDPAFALSSFSVGAWVNVHATSYNVFYRGDLDTLSMSFGMNYSTGGIGLWIGTGAQTDSLFAPISYNQWHQVTATFDGTQGLMTVYIDGVMAAQKGTTARPPLVLNPSLLPGLGIGNTEANTDFPLLGDIDEVVLYSRVLASDEIATLASAPCVPHGATAIAQVVNGFVVGATITDEGCGYTNAPVVTIQGGSGTGATATAVVLNGRVVAVTITSAGIGYTNPPVIHISAPSGPQVTLIKAVKPAFSDLLIGTSYQLQVSADLNTWTNQGSPFTATNSAMVYPQYWDVVNWGKLFFRLQVGP